MQDTAGIFVKRLRLGSVDYLWRDGELLGEGDRRVPLRAKSLKMFVVLLEHRGRVLSKDQLSELVWPGTIATDESIARCVADIRKALKDDTHKIVQTFPKQGYKLNANVPAEGGTPWRAARVRKETVVLLAIAIAVLLVWPILPHDAGRWIDTAENRPPATGLREAVAILPFSADSDSDHFLASGLADDLEIHLSEMSAIKLVSRSHVLAVRDAQQGPVALARSLNIRYFVDGDVREDGGTVALSVRLIDGSDGTTLWADRYEGSQQGLMGFRKTLPEALVDAMAIELNAGDRRRLAFEDTDDPVAFEEVIHARREINAFTYEGSLSAERHLRRAIARDPNYARAYAELASVFAIRMENNWIVISSADEDKAFYFAQEALRLDEGLWFAHYALGRLHSVATIGDVQSALAHLSRAMSLQPANDDPRAYFAIVTAMSGNLDDGAAIFESIMATHPQPPFWYYLGLANVQFHQKQYLKAADSLTVCLAQMPNSPYCLRTQIAVQARLARLDDAAWAAEEYAILGHEVSLKALMQTAIESDPALRSHLENSYKLAGIE